MGFYKLFDLTGGVYFNFYINSDYPWILVFIAMVLEYDFLFGEALIFYVKMQKQMDKPLLLAPASVGRHNPTRVEEVGRKNILNYSHD